MPQIPVLYLCVGMNDLGGTSSHMRNIVSAAPSAGLDPFLWIATKMPETIENYFRGVPGRLAIHKNYKFGFYLPLIWRLAKDLRTHRIRVIHSFQLQGDIIAIAATMLAKVGAKISSFEGRLVYGSTRWRGWILAMLNRLVRPWFSANIFISRHLMETYGNAYRIPHSKRYLNYLGVPAIWFEGPLPPRSAPNPFRIGFVGRIDSEKGYELFIEAVHYLSKRTWPAAFCMVGSGQCEADARTRIAQFGLQDHIEMRGWRPDIRAELDALDIVVMSSHEEGLPNVAIESLSRKRVVVASRVGGVPEVIEDGRTGYLVEPENVKALADAIQTAVLNWADSIKRAEAGYQSTVERFSIQREVRGFHAIYESLLQPRTAAL